MQLSEINIISILLTLNALGWSIAWLLFRTQFSALGTKVDKLFERVDDMNERLIKTEVLVDIQVKKDIQ